MKTYHHSSKQRGFSLIEMLVAFTITASIIILLLGALQPISNAWIQGNRRIDTYQRARGALEMMARELTPAVVDTRMQMILLPGEELETAGATSVAANSPAMLWLAPIGANGELRCVGYYLYRDDERQFYRLKRLFVKPDNADYFPELVNLENARDVQQTDPTSASWFLDNWDETAFDEEDPSNDDTIVSTAADGIIGLWIQPFDLLGNPIPWVSKADNHPSSNLIYNSAAFFQVATTKPFDSGETFSYMAQTRLAMKANRVPAEVEITVVTIDKVTLERGTAIPEMQLEFQSSGALDVESSVKLFEAELKARGINRAKVFTTRVKLVNGAG